MAIIAVCNQKGGCGKTTIAINLAQAFVIEGCDVLFLDMDPQGSAADWRSIAPGLGSGVPGSGDRAGGSTAPSSWAEAAARYHHHRLSSAIRSGEFGSHQGI